MIIKSEKSGETEVKEEVNNEDETEEIIPEVKEEEVGLKKDNEDDERLWRCQQADAEV